MTASLGTFSEAQAGPFLDDDILRIYTGPASFHFHKRDYNNSLKLVGVEWESPSGWEVGANSFNNSYRQKSEYIYVGKKFLLYGEPDNHFFFNITAGALIGYRKPYDNKIPINFDGVGLGVIPSLGYKYKRVNGQFILVGTSAIMGTIGVDIWK